MPLSAQNKALLNESLDRLLAQAPDELQPLVEVYGPVVSRMAEDELEGLLGLLDRTLGGDELLARVKERMTLGQLAQENRILADAAAAMAERSIVRRQFQDDVANVVLNVGLKALLGAL